MKTEERSRRTWTLGYGGPSVDFVNTRWDRFKANPAESFVRAQDVLDWLRTRRLLDRRSHRRWAVRLHRSPRLGRQFLEHAVRLREALYGVFWSIAHREEPRAGHVRTVNRVLAMVRTHPRLSLRPRSHFTLTYRHDNNPLAELLGPIAVAAARLLSEEARQRLRRCFNPECGVIFFDRTKNKRRRWCHMRVCGSRIKMRRYRQRARLASRTAR